MKTQIMSAALAATLGLSMPMTAEAALVKVETNAQVELVRNDHYGHHYKSPQHYRGHGSSHYSPNYYGGRSYHHQPPPAAYHHRQVRPWSYWRPYATRHHYHSFGQPVYYASHQSYGPYYRVRAYDRSDVALWLGISAVTGAILYSNY